MELEGEYKSKDEANQHFMEHQPLDMKKSDEAGNKKDIKEKAVLRVRSEDEDVLTLFLKL